MRRESSELLRVRDPQERVDPSAVRLDLSDGFDDGLRDCDERRPAIDFDDLERRPCLELPEDAFKEACNTVGTFDDLERRLRMSPAVRHGPSFCDEQCLQSLHIPFAEGVEKDAEYLVVSLSRRREARPILSHMLARSM